MGRKTLRRALRLITTLLAGLGLLVVLICATSLVSWFARLLAGPWNDPDGDILIVLGGSVETDEVFGLD